MEPDPLRAPAGTLDAHHHLWRYSEAEYGWIDETMSLLQRDFLLLDLQREAERAGIDGTIVVQARQTVEETQWLLDLARSSQFVRGVVGWADIGGEDFPTQLRRWADEPKLVGLRHVVQGEPAGFLDGDGFNRGIGELQGTGMVYDLLIFERQMEEAIRFVDRHPDQVFVLDHIAKPRIAAGELEPWRTQLAALARRPNVWCKVSGMVTEADWRQWSPAVLAPYLDAVVAAFGPARLLAGSDWPVCLVACSYAHWWEVLRTYFDAFSSVEKASIFGGCAARVYGVPWT
jgi:L-fuconolactonase